MPTLHERFADLAEDAPVSPTPPRLWVDGRRRHRRRLAAAVAVAAAVLASVGVGYGDVHSRQPEPVAPPVGGADAIPDRLFNPSPWTPATSAPGRLVAVFTATQDHFPFGSERNAWVGVGAGTQTYRFLDLPGQDVDHVDVALSPDGRHLAYWIVSVATDPTPPGSVAGVGVLDLATGTVERHVLSTGHPLAPGTITWLGNRDVAAVAGHVPTRSSTLYAGRPRTYVFASAGDTGGYATLAPAPVLDVPVTTRLGYAELDGNRRLRFTRAGAPVDDQEARLSTAVKSLALDLPSGWVAATRGSIDDGGSTSGPLVVGRLADGRVDFRRVPGGRPYYQAVAWVDGSHVAATRLTRHGIVYDEVDVRTGKSRELTSKPWYSFAVATDSLRHVTTVPGVAPPSPWNPRWLALGGLVVVVVALGGLALTWWRRRVRA